MKWLVGRETWYNGLLIEIQTIISLHLTDMFDEDEPIASFYSKYKIQQQIGIEGLLTEIFQQFYSSDETYASYLSMLPYEAHKWGETWAKHDIPEKVLLKGMYNLRMHAFDRVQKAMRGWNDTDEKDLILSRLHEMLSLRYHHTVIGFLSHKDKRISHLHQQKIGIMGQMAAGMAHEIRNPLTAFQGFLQLMSHSLSPEDFDPERFRQYIEICQKEIQALEGLLTNFLILARKDELARKEVQQIELRTLLHRVYDLSRYYVIEKDVDLSFTYDDGQYLVWAISSHVEQVCLNLIKNAVDAVAAGGKVRVRTTREAHSSHVMITIEDDGCGISESRKRHLFEPFYTTKEKGTGIGLSVCKKLLEEMGGSIQIDSTEGRGTCVEVRLQCIPDQRFHQVKTGT
ncbi:HAMP domain-containing histidine kinase [Brevibacillus ruminantium]|uniref:histidine kinase n=1 Tax=Brevibacillus ruminantium TaxID=2950604 RepID=A0ABY4WII5_9BACL|nr:HAMP domain-containing sensor histidine kinase [Brevibacillus ruminantium]USG66927.1 HAMP domain-containing histidine kinase [Brevibacillus ruminantium]